MDDMPTLIEVLLAGVHRRSSHGPGQPGHAKKS